MSKPNISVVIEPSVGGKVVYEPAARKVVSGKPVGIICLRLSIQNKNRRRWVHLTKVTLSFSKPPSVPDKVIPVPDNWPGVWLDDSGNTVQGTGVRIAPRATFVWSFFRDVVNVDTNEFENDTAVLPLPAPASMTLSLFCKNCSSPWKVTKTLAAHTNPVDGGAYAFPARIDDLEPGEFWSASSNTHGTGQDGSQLFGYDMGVFAFDPEETDVGRESNGLNRILPGKDGSKNKHYRVWGKKIHAMAAGSVVQFLEGVGANYFPGTGNEAGPWQESPWDNPDLAWSDHVGSGNHFYIQHGNEVVLYAHMQKGSLTKKLLRVGAKVKAGQLLGLAGNAGSSTEPHLHIHAIKGTAAEDGPLRPLLFRDTFAIDPAALSFPSLTGPWARVRRQGPPAVDSGALIWPLNRNPEWHGWQDLGGRIKSGPAVASWGVDRLDVFAASGSGKLKHKWWDGSAWHAWQTLGGTFKGAPAAVSWGPDRIDVFVRGTDDHLGHLWWDGDEWKGWQDLGGPIKSGPAVSSWGRTGSMFLPRGRMASSSISGGMAPPGVAGRISVASSRIGPPRSRGGWAGSTSSSAAWMTISAISGGAAASGKAGRISAARSNLRPRSPPGGRTGSMSLPRDRTISSPTKPGTARLGATGIGSAVISRAPLRRSPGDRDESTSSSAGPTTVSAICGWDRLGWLSHNRGREASVHARRCRLDEFIAKSSRSQDHSPAPKKCASEKVYRLRFAAEGGQEKPRTVLSALQRHHAQVDRAVRLTNSPLTRHSGFLGVPNC